MSKVRAGYSRAIDYFANKRWLVVTGLIGTALGIVAEILDIASTFAVEVQGTEVGIWQTLPLVLALVGQVRANSNRYVEELRDAIDELHETAVFIDPAARLP